MPPSRGQKVQQTNHRSQSVNKMHKLFVYHRTCCSDMFLTPSRWEPPGSRVDTFPLGDHTPSPCRWNCPARSKKPLENHGAHRSFVYLSFPSGSSEIRRACVFYEFPTVCLLWLDSSNGMGLAPSLDAPTVRRLITCSNRMCLLKISCPAVKSDGSSSSPLSATGQALVPTHR